MTQPDGYPYPPLVPEDPEEVARRLAQHLGDAWDEVLERQEQVLRSANDLRRAETLAKLQDLQDAVGAFQRTTMSSAERYAREQVPAIYGSAVQQQLGTQMTWTDLHRETVELLAADSYDDLLRRSQEAGRTSARFAREVRRVARERTAFQVTGGRTAQQVGQDLRKRLEARGLSVVTYANGREVSMRTYTSMAVRTKTGVAHNLGSLNGMKDSEVLWVEVFDGADCGWSGHKDPDKANGTLRRLEDAQAHLLSHPNCRRAFGARPDVRTKQDAAEAAPSTTVEQRADQAASEGAASVRANRSAENRRSARQRLRDKRAAAVAAAEPLAGVDLAAMSDDDLADLMTADAVIADERALQSVCDELDRRDAAEAAAAAGPAAPAPEVVRSPAEVLATGARNASEQQLVADWYRQMEERDAAARAVRADVLPPARVRASPDQMLRQEYEVLLESNIMAAEEATRGALFSREGVRAGVSERMLWEADAVQAARWASEELREFWRTDPRNRTTWLQFRSPNTPRARRSRERFEKALQERESRRTR